MTFVSCLTENSVPTTTLQNPILRGATFVPTPHWGPHLQEAQWGPTPHSGERLSCLHLVELLYTHITCKKLNEALIERPSLSRHSLRCRQKSFSQKQWGVGKRVIPRSFCLGLIELLASNVCVWERESVCVHICVWNDSSLSFKFCVCDTESVCVCVFVCVWERERERERWATCEVEEVNYMNWCRGSEV